MLRLGLRYAVGRLLWADDLGPAQLRPVEVLFDALAQLRLHCRQALIKLAQSA